MICWSCSARIAMLVEIITGPKAELDGFYVESELGPVVWTANIRFAIAISPLIVPFTWTSFCCMFGGGGGICAAHSIMTRR